MDPAAPSRRRTLWATIDWTVGLLGDEARRLLAGLAVFHGGWTLEAAAAVVADPLGLDREAVPSLVAELAEQSMVRVDPPATGAARYGMLATIRAYAADRLAASGCGDAIADRHAAHFVALAERAVPHRRGPLEPAWVGELTVELDNLRAAYRRALEAERPAEALRLVAALSDDIVMREQHEMGRWAEELAAHPEVADEPLRATALAIASNTALMDGRLEAAWQLSQAAMEVEARTGAAPAWPARNTQGLVIATGAVDGDWHEPFEAMFAITEQSGDPLPAAVAHYARVLVPALGGAPERGLDHAEALTELGTRSANPTIMAMGLLTHGIAVAGTDPDRASRDYDQALVAATAAHNTLVVHQTRRAIEELDARAGDRTTAATALDALRAIARQFERTGNVTEQVKTILAMLDPIVGRGALVPAATICGALSRTH